MCKFTLISYSTRPHIKYNTKSILLRKPRLSWLEYLQFKYACHMFSGNLCGTITGKLSEKQINFIDRQHSDIMIHSTSQQYQPDNDD